MKAIVKQHAGEGLSLQDVPKPEIGINDVLIKVEKTSICGTDVHIYDWDSWAQKTIKPPMVIGHEFVGQIKVTGLTSVIEKYAAFDSEEVWLGKDDAGKARGFQIGTFVKYSDGLDWADLKAQGASDRVLGPTHAVRWTS